MTAPVDAARAMAGKMRSGGFHVGDTADMLEALAAEVERRIEPSVVEDMLRAAEPILSEALNAAEAEVEALRHDNDALREAANEAAAEAQEQRSFKDAAYLERNKLVALLASLYPSGIKRTAIAGWSDDWHGCVYIDFPWGQASWHYHDTQAGLFNHLPPYTGDWNGHTTEAKYEAIVQASRENRATIAALEARVEAMRVAEWNKAVTASAQMAGLWSVPEDGPDMSEAEARAFADGKLHAIEMVRKLLKPALPLPSDTAPGDIPGLRASQPGEASVSSAPAHDPVAEAARVLLENANGNFEMDDGERGYLVHSDDMDRLKDVVLRKHPVAVPRCTATTTARLYSKPHQCPYAATVEIDGDWLCQKHADLWVQAEGRAALSQKDTP